MDRMEVCQQTASRTCKRLKASQTTSTKKFNKKTCKKGAQKYCEKTFKGSRREQKKCNKLIVKKCNESVKTTTKMINFWNAVKWRWNIVCLQTL